MPAPPKAESLIAEHWQELLDVASVSPDDMFVNLGGDSMLATILSYRIEEEFGFRPSIEEILQYTLRELASFCEQQSLKKRGKTASR